MLQRVNAVVATLGILLSIGKKDLFTEKFNWKRRKAAQNKAGF